MSKIAYIMFASLIVLMVTLNNYSIVSDSDSGGSRTHGGGYVGGYVGGSAGGHK
ncbi:hypothetical protein ACFPVS_03445 [Neisseria weixii]|uniref:hypothetical protein n=1 Tax=Neisseria TaxID=482 RepID=UPI00189D3464|nr:MULTISPECIES: hypothetical protein [Neisseria]